MSGKFGLVVVLLAACSSTPRGPKPDDITAGESGGEPTGGKIGGTGGKGGGSGGTTGGAGGSVATGGSVGSTGGASGSGTGGSAATGGSSGGSPATGYNFGAHPQTYPTGSIKPAGTQAELDAVVAAAYDKWKAAYVGKGCGGYVVKTTATRTTSATLGHGAIITAIMAGHDPEAQAIFDGIHAVARKYPSILSKTVPAKHGIEPRSGNQYLLANELNLRTSGQDLTCEMPSEDDAAPDGDIAFALALTLADKQWGSTGAINYLEQARLTAKAIKDYDMNPRKLPGLGDWASLPGEGMWTTVATPPNYALGHFRAFGKASGDAYWMEAVAAAQASIERVQTMFSPMTGLFPQVLVGSQSLSGGTFLTEQNANAHFGDASLLPLWLAADYIGGGGEKTRATLTKINDWIKGKTGGDPSKIVDGYRLNGDPIGTKGTMAYVAPFATVSIFDAGNQAWLDATWKLMAAAPATSQSADTANLLGMLVVTGNWWQP